MLEILADLPGKHLELGPYGEDFDARFWSLRDAPIYKIERQQTFRQPENASWVASTQGRWAQSLRMLEQGRPALEQLFARIAAQGSQVRRVRVVEEPLAPYLHWELHSLHLRAQCGEDVRVIPPEPIAAWEKRQVVPEIVTLGDLATYRILYDALGVLAGAVLYTDPEITAGCRAEIASLHRNAEGLKSFFARRVVKDNNPDLY